MTTFAGRFANEQTNKRVISRHECVNSELVSYSDASNMPNLVVAAGLGRIRRVPDKSPCCLRDTLGFQDRAAEKDIRSENMDKIFIID